MRINISWWCAHYPEAFGIRKVLQRIKVKRIIRYMLTKSEIKICEDNPLRKEEIITLYLKKWEKYLKPCVFEMNVMIEKSPVFVGGDINDVKFEDYLKRMSKVI